MSSAVAKQIAQIAEESLASHNKFSIAFSGGETPKILYRLLESDYRNTIDWSRVQIYWGDERYVSHDDPASNYRMARETLLDHVPIPPENIHPIPTSLADPNDSAIAYAAEIKSALRFDLILLGLGDDGHTASLFPGSEFNPNDERIAIVTHSPKPPALRISLTMQVINLSKNILFLVAGSDKADVLREVIQNENNPAYPASFVRDAQWFVDEAAASCLNAAARL
jgi:6-phosphogluconolactonase